MQYQAADNNLALTFNSTILSTSEKIFNTPTTEYNYPVTWSAKKAGSPYFRHVFYKFSATNFSVEVFPQKKIIQLNSYL